MNLLEKFKKRVGETTTANDSYFVEYINEAIEKAGENSRYLKYTRLDLKPTVKEYDLSDSDIATPVVDNGIVELIHDDFWSTAGYKYRKDFNLKNKNTLIFVEEVNLVTTAIRFRYKSYFNPATYTEESYTASTDLPEKLKNPILKYALAEYGIDNIMNPSPSSDYAVSSKKEFGVEVTYMSAEKRSNFLEMQKHKAISEIKELSGNKNIFKSYNLF